MADDSELRIFCICGQKMRVSPEMYGQPGRCVSCQQKIRVPRRDEVPDNVRELFLKEHPEFLRHTRVRPLDEKSAVAAVPDARVGADDEAAEHPGTVPLDVLEPLQQLCSLQWKIEHHVPAQGLEADRSLEEARERIRTARAALNEELRQRLMEVAVELASTHEKLAEGTLSVRVGETDFWAYRKLMAKLRRRRDYLERRQENLRGWIATVDPYVAGGYVDLSVTRIPQEGFRISALDQEDHLPVLLDWHTRGLRDGLSQREQAERHLGEIEKIETGRDFAAARMRWRAEKLRAEAEIWFRRDRLEQLKADYASDIQCADAQLDHLRGRLQMGEITRSQFNAQERDLTRAKADLTKASDVIIRALSANSSKDVPSLRGTFMHRLAGEGDPIAHAWDVWIAWGAAGAILISLFLPIVGGISPVGAQVTMDDAGGAARWLLVIPLLIAALLAAFSFIPLRNARGLLFCGLGFLGGIGWFAFCHELLYDTGPLGWEYRRSLALFAPGMLLLCLGLLAIAAAACAALIPDQRLRMALPAAAAAAMVSLGIVATDFLGLSAPWLSVEARVQEAVPDAQGQRQTSITFANRGFRAWRLRKEPDARAEFSCRIECIDSRGARARLNLPSPESEWILSGKKAEFAFDLAPGEYWIVMASRDGGGISEHFTVEDTERSPSATARGVDPAPDRLDGEEPPLAQAPERPYAPPPRQEVSITLSGIVSQEDRPPAFRITVKTAAGGEQRILLTLGDTVYGDWRIAEYNPRQRTVTLVEISESQEPQPGNADPEPAVLAIPPGAKLLVLRTGEPQALPER